MQSEIATKQHRIKRNKMKITGTLVDILATVPGAFVLIGLLSVSIVIGIFLTVFGIIAPVRR